MPDSPEKISAIIEATAGADRFIFPNVNMTNIPLRVARSGLGGLMVLVVIFTILEDGMNPLVRVLILVTALTGGLLACLFEPAAGNVIVTVSEDGVILQRGSRLLNPPTRVDRADIIHVLLMPAFAGTAQLNKGASDLSPLGAVILQRRSVEPLVLVSGCPKAALVPLVDKIVERFGLEPAKIPLAASPSVSRVADAPPAAVALASRETAMPPVPVVESPDLHLDVSNLINPTHALELLDYSLEPLDGRIHITRDEDRLTIRIRRVSTFWQPVSLIAVITILTPILCFALHFGIWGFYAAVVGPSGDSFRSSLWLYASTLMLSLAILLVVAVSAIKRHTIVANRQSLTVQTTWGWLKRRVEIQAAAVRTFGVRQTAVSGAWGAVPEHDLYMQKRSGGNCSLLRTVRFSQEQIGSIATMLRKFYNL